MSIPTLAGAGWIVAAVVMAALWAWQVRSGNAAIVDAGWAALTAGLSIADAAAGTGAPWRRAAVATMFAIWGVRLTLLLLVDRVFGKPEDGRYAALRRPRGARANAWFFWFFEVQAVAAVMFSLPALTATANGAPETSALEAAAIVLWGIGFAGEATADRQLLRFKQDPGSKGRTCRAGLWRYSRHPNYFFEWVIWVAYALFATASPFGWVAWSCPALMLYLLFKVTGIPAAEAQALRSRGDEYRRYQQTTSAFVPWFPSA